MYLFGEHRAISATASVRVQRWALTLSGYLSSVINCTPTRFQADGLSRLPLPTTLTEVPKPAETILLMEQLNASLVTTAQIRSWTDKDPTLVKVRKSVLDPYFQRREEKN